MAIPYGAPVRRCPQSPARLTVYAEAPTFRRSDAAPTLPRAQARQCSNSPALANATRLVPHRAIVPACRDTDASQPARHWRIAAWCACCRTRAHRRSAVGSALYQSHQSHQLHQSHQIHQPHQASARSESSQLVAAATARRLRSCRKRATARRTRRRTRCRIAPLAWARIGCRAPTLHVAPARRSPPIPSLPSARDAARRLRKAGHRGGQRHRVASGLDCLPTRTRAYQNSTLWRLRKRSVRSSVRRG